MEEIFQVIAFIVFGIFVLARRFVKKKKLADQDQESQDGGGMKLLRQYRRQPLLQNERLQTFP